MQPFGRRRPGGKKKTIQRPLRKAIGHQDCSLAIGRDLGGFGVGDEGVGAEGECSAVVGGAVAGDDADDGGAGAGGFLEGAVGGQLAFADAELGAVGQLLIVEAAADGLGLEVLPVDGLHGLLDVRGAKGVKHTG